MAKTPKVAPLVHRVYTLPPESKKAVVAARTRSRQTTRQWLTAATTDTLPALITDLAAIGLAAPKTRKPCRWRWDAEALEALRQAATVTGLPQNLLLALLVQRHAAAKPAKTRRAAKGGK